CADREPAERGCGAAQCVCVQREHGQQQKQSEQPRHHHEGEHGDCAPLDVVHGDDVDAWQRSALCDVAPYSTSFFDLLSPGMPSITVRGARTHNLQNVELELPRERLIVITGLSGSGKSSLAFDTISADGQRRYVESLSAYARQFLSVMEKPDVDQIDGLSPAIAIEQKATSHNPRSTVGTVTEIYDYLRLLYARAGIPRCPDHGVELVAQTVSQMVDQVLALPDGTRLMLLAPVVKE